MAQRGQRKCLCCAEYFDVDYRNRERQRFCANTACRRASKVASQAAWLGKAQNAEYFCGPVHVARVQAWRAAHPGYGRGQPRRAAPLQDALIAQVPDLIEEYPLRTESAAALGGRALQEHWDAPSPVLAGLIAHLFEVTLQEDIAALIRRLVQLGHDVMNRSGDADSQASATARAAAPSARAVQLG
jgi:hypothetical protein